MPDREAFVAAIAANPADDLPRLVFADWLDEHGDPERAEFIRAQVYKQHELADLLFYTHGERWNAEILPLLGIDPAGYEIRSNATSWWHTLPDGSQRRSLGGSCITQNLYTRDEHVGSFTYDRGFITQLDLPPLDTLGRCSFAAACAREPITELSLDFGEAAESGVWSRATDPALRRVRELTVVVPARTPTPVAATLFDDPHLAGVRKLNLRGSSASWFSHERLAADVLTHFGRSPLAYRLDEVSLLEADHAGVRAMCRNRQFHWKDLIIDGPLGPDSTAHLADASLTATLRRLHVSLSSGEEGDLELGDRGVQALAAGWWRALTDLTLEYANMTEVGLRALAAASFTPQLEHLDLGCNYRMIDERGRMDGLRELGNALDPDRLKSLGLSRTGLTAVPDFLTERFGDRVKVG